MSRATSSVARRERHKKVLKLAKGYRGRSKNNFRIALQKVEKALQYAYRDRRVRKRDFRQLWIARINAAARINGLSYSRLIHGLDKAGVEVNRKVLADLAVRDPVTFTAIAEQAKANL